MLFGFYTAAAEAQKALSEIEKARMESEINQQRFDMLRSIERNNRNRDAEDVEFTETVRQPKLLAEK